MSAGRTLSRIVRRVAPYATPSQRRAPRTSRSHAGTGHRRQVDAVLGRRPARHRCVIGTPVAEGETLRESAMPRVVIIGAGIVGGPRRRAHRARLDRRHRPRPGTAVAPVAPARTRPGWCSRPTAPKALADFAQYTVAQVPAEEPEGLGFNQVGGLELATTPQRLAELHRRHGWATALGDRRGDHLNRRACADLHPLVAAAGCSAGCTCPTDGLANAVAAGRGAGPTRRRSAARRSSAATRCSTCGSPADGCARSSPPRFTPSRLVDWAASTSRVATRPEAEREALLTAVAELARTHPDLHEQPVFAMPYTTVALRFCRSR